MNFSSIRAHIASATARPQVVVAALLVGATAILVRVHVEYPISEWMLLSLARSWLLSLLWLLACGSLGWRTLRLIGADFDSPAIRHLMAVTAGVALFALVVAGAGLAGVLGLAFFLLAPLACLAVSGTGYGADLMSVSRSLVQAVRSTRLSAPLIFAICIFVVGLLLVYAPTLSPHNVQHDARWYHLPIAQQYASQGSLRPFPEGWFLASYPHLSSLLYTWAMLMPASIVARLELVAHLEFALFCVTLAGVAIAGRTLTGSRSGYLAATLVFLFPGFLVYDSNLSSGADHVAAFWAPALLILLSFHLDPLPCRRLGARGPPDWSCGRHQVLRNMSGGSGGRIPSYSNFTPRSGRPRKTKPVAGSTAARLGRWHRPHCRHPALAE